MTARGSAATRRDAPMDKAMIGRVTVDSQPRGESVNGDVTGRLEPAQVDREEVTRPRAMRKPGIAKPSTD